MAWHQVELRYRSPDEIEAVLALDGVRAPCRMRLETSGDGYACMLKAEESVLDQLRALDGIDIGDVVNLEEMLQLAPEDRGEESLGVGASVEERGSWNGFSTLPEIYNQLHVNGQVAGTQSGKIFELPNPSIGGAKILGLHAGRTLDPRLPTVLLLGGVHGDEPIPPEVLCRFMGDLLGAYTVGGPLRLGCLKVPPEEVRAIVEKTNIVVVPVINPDGRHRTLSTGGRELHRKNARGVDINRNFGPLWQAEDYFIPEARHENTTIGYGRASELYRGPAQESEPETQNVLWLFDCFPNIRAMVDVHSGTKDRLILHNWGHDEPGQDPNQQFTRVRGQRVIGKKNDSYREYIAPDDLKKIQALAAKSSSYGAAADRVGWDYKPSFQGLWATCATSDDYAMSRHIVSKGRLPKCYGYTMEIGPDVSNTWEEIVRRQQEVAGAIVGFLAEFANQRFPAMN